MNATLPRQEHNKRTAGFPRRYRLTRTDDFSSVFSFRRAFRSPRFLLHYRPQEPHADGRARLGLVVAKRYLRRSVDRNLIKRLVREAFRLKQSDLAPYDLVFRLAGKPERPLDRRALTSEIKNLLEKLRTIRP